MHVRCTLDDRILGDWSITFTNHIYDTDRPVSLFRHLSKYSLVVDVVGQSIKHYFHTVTLFLLGHWNSMYDVYERDDAYVHWWLGYSTGSGIL